VALGEVTLGVNSMIAGSLSAIVGVQVGSLGVFATVASDPIQRPEDPITSWITQYATLERGPLLASLRSLLVVCMLVG